MLLKMYIQYHYKYIKTTKHYLINSKQFVFNALKGFKDISDNNI